MRGLEDIESNPLVNQVAVALSHASPSAGTNGSGFGTSRKNQINRSVVAVQLDSTHGTHGTNKTASKGLNAPDLLSVPGIAQHRFFRRLLDKINKVRILFKSFHLTTCRICMSFTYFSHPPSLPFMLA